MDLIGDMDPYIVIQCGGDKYRTKVKRNAGCLVSWKNDEQKFEIRLKSHFDMIKLSGHDQDIIYDDFLGQSKEFKASVLEELTRHTTWVDLFNKGQKSGSVKIQSKILTQKQLDDAKLGSLTKTINEKKIEGTTSGSQQPFDAP